MRVFNIFSGIKSQTRLDFTVPARWMRSWRPVRIVALVGILLSLLITISARAQTAADGSYTNEQVTAILKQAVSDDGLQLSKFLSYEQVRQKLLNIESKSNGEVDVMSVNKFVHGVCDIGEPCTYNFPNKPTKPMPGIGKCTLPSQPGFNEDCRGAGIYDLRSVQGRDLLLAKVGSGPKVLLWLTGVHGPEDGPNTGAVLKVIEKLGGNTAWAKDIRNKITLYTMVRVNPDGAEVVERGDCRKDYKGPCKHQLRRNANNFDLNRYMSVNNERGDFANPIFISDKELFKTVPESLAYIQVYKRLRGINSPDVGGINFTKNIEYMTDWHTNEPLVTCELTVNNDGEAVCKNEQEFKYVTVQPATQPGVNYGSSSTQNKAYTLIYLLFKDTEGKNGIHFSQYPWFNYRPFVNPAYFGSTDDVMLYNTPAMTLEVSFSSHFDLITLVSNYNLGDRALDVMTKIVEKLMLTHIDIVAKNKLASVSDPITKYIAEVPVPTGDAADTTRAAPFSNDIPDDAATLIGFDLSLDEIMPFECWEPYFGPDITVLSIEKLITNYDLCAKMDEKDTNFPPFDWANFPIP